jgi:hypothetical protein
MNNSNRCKLKNKKIKGIGEVKRVESCRNTFSGRRSNAGRAEIRPNKINLFIDTVRIKFF